MGTNEYKVVSGVELTKVEDGALVRYRRYQLKTKGGMVIWVDLDEPDWSDDKAGPIFLKAAQEADKILSLKG